MPGNFVFDRVAQTAEKLTDRAPSKHKWIWASKPAETGEWLSKGLKYEALVVHEEDCVEEDTTEEGPSCAHSFMICNAQARVSRVPKNLTRCFPSFPRRPV